MEIDPTSAIQEMVEQCIRFVLVRVVVLTRASLVSRPERNDGLDDARSGLCNPRRRRSHEFRRDHEVVSSIRFRCSRS
jgi:hypothetical protein